MSEIRKTEGRFPCHLYEIRDAEEAYKAMDVVQQGDGSFRCMNKRPRIFFRGRVLLDMLILSFIILCCLSSE